MPSASEGRTLDHLIIRGQVAELTTFLRRHKPWLGPYDGRINKIRKAFNQCRTNEHEVLSLLVNAGWNVTGERFDAEGEARVKAILQNGPSWRMDARKQGVAKIHIVLSKAWGLAFVPGDVVAPMRYGGGYDGEYPKTASEALELLEKDAGNSYAEHVTRAGWFERYLRRINKDKEFDLADVLGEIEDKSMIRRVQEE